MLRDLIKTLSQPSKFEGDPYGGLLNQWGHYSLGVACFVLIATGHFAFFGEMPYRWLVAGLLIAFYAICIEWIWQGWRGLDSMEDTLFYAMGPLTVAVSVVEVSAAYPISYVAVRPVWAFTAVASAAGASIVYAISRIK